MHYILGALALLIISIVQLRSDAFSRTTAYLGIMANLLAFGLYVPNIGVYISILSVFPFLTIWLILSARTFLQLGRSDYKAQSQRQVSASDFHYQQDPKRA